MGIEKKVQNADIPEANANQSYGVMDRFREGIKGSKAYKGLVGVLSGLALAYAVNTADLNNGRVMNTASAEQAEASVPYKQMHLDDEDTFKDKIADSGLCWVMYQYNGPNPDSEKNPEDIDRRRNKFWNILKNEFGSQVDSYIIVDTTNWSTKYSENRAISEIGENSFPTFMLYNNGDIVNEGTKNDMRIRGAPPDKHMDQAINYVKKYTNLK